MEKLSPVKEFEQLLPIEYTRGLEIREVLACKIKKLKVSEFVEYSKKNRLLDPNEFDHLKLVNGSMEDQNDLTILVCTKETEAKLDRAELERFEIKEVFPVQVSRYPPYTKEQYKEFGKQWPIQFKAKGTEIDTLSEKEKDFVRQKMKEVTDMAFLAKTRGGRQNACLLVDSKTQKTYAKASDDTEGKISSIEHCIMRLAREFSKSQQEKFDFDKEPEELKKENAEETKTIGEKTKSNVDLGMYHRSSNNYYFTDLDLIIFMEPCIMCAMALIHSRIRKVFYCVEHTQPGFGGLNQNLPINNFGKLNHKYFVFKGVGLEYLQLKAKADKTE